MRGVVGGAAVAAMLIAGVAWAQAPAPKADPAPKAEPAPRAAPEFPAPVTAAMPAVVTVEATAARNARSARTLGVNRSGHGVVIDGDGLVLTIGYLILEAESIEVAYEGGKRLPASVVAYDYDSGFGLVRTALPLKVAPLKLGDSDPLKVRDEVYVLGAGGADNAQKALVSDRRDFAGYWEYLLENALFVVPPVPNWAGTALVGADGALLGVGSLFVQDAFRAGGRTLPGNMFVPVGRLKPILAELLASGKAGAPKPWLGLNTVEHGGQLVVVNVQNGSPAEAAGMKRGDVIVGLGDKPLSGAAEFYRKLWASGEAGVRVTLKVERDGAMQEVTVATGDRYKYMRGGGSL